MSPVLSPDTKEASAQIGLAMLQKARREGDELAASLAEAELNRALDAIAAERAPGAPERPARGRRARGRASA